MSSKSSRKKSSIQSSRLSKKKQSTKLKTIILNEKNIHRYLPISEIDIEPKVWEIPNRKSYYNWFYNTFKQYGIGEKLKKERGELQLFRIQRLVKNFFQTSNPNRGVLLYHGLGFGKSCAAISITQSNPNKDVIFLSKASLESNFVYEIKQCGMSYMRTNNYWVFTKCKTEKEIDLARRMNIPAKIIRENNGCFLIDFETNNKSNYDKLSNNEKTKLNKQLEETIYSRFTFYHLDDTRIVRKIEEGEFDDKIVIVDEVHNLINSMANETVTGEFFYKIMMESKNSKFVFLSATPLINNVYESVKMFNILHGKIPTLIYKIIIRPDTVLNWKEIKTKLATNLYVDQVVIDKTRKFVKLTQNPENFINYKKDKTMTKSRSKSRTKELWDGIKYSPEDNITFENFREQIDIIMKGLGKHQKFAMKFNFENNTILPENDMEFERLFFNPELNKIKNKEIIRKRISGLTSYYDIVHDKSVYPELKGINIVLVPMSEYQLGKYSEVRNKEIIKEKNQAKKQNAKEMKSSFRIYSRLFCSFVFPEEIGSPYDKNVKQKMSILEKLEDIEDVSEVETKYKNSLKRKLSKSKRESNPKFSFTEKSVNEKDYKMNAKENQLLVKHYMDELTKEKDTFLNLDRLHTYSPKYHRIISNILKSYGSCFLYSQFINMIGLKIFGLCLQATKQFEQFVIRKVDQKYQLVFEGNIYDKSKMRYVIFAGDIQDKELKEILRLIFNSDYEKLPPSCNFLKKQLEKMYGSDRNRHGQIIKLFMTTRTGAEGISLYNVRQVHIMEPYWQPVLIDQVIGRARRMGSHKMLPSKEQDVEVFVYMTCFSDEQASNITVSTLKKDIAKYEDGLNKKGKMITSDEFLYILSERKKKIINEFNLLIMESAFDCTLNYTDNIKKQTKIKCIDYDTKNRDAYLYTANIDDTIDIIEIEQEYVTKINYLKIAIPKGSSNYFYINETPQSGERRFLYSKEILNKVGSKPIGEIIVINGKKKIVLFKKKKKTS